MARMLDSHNLQTQTKQWLLQTLLLRHATVDYPEQKLMAAVLCKAIDDLFVVGAQSQPSNMVIMRNRRKEAAKFFLRRQHDYFCDMIGLNPDWVFEVVRDFGGLHEISVGARC